MKTIISALVIVCALFFAASDVHADGSLKDTIAVGQPARCSGGAFSGFYVGGQLGGGSLRSEAQGQGADAIREKDGGFTIGGHDGYNVQCGQVLFGMESDFNYFGAENKFDCGTCGQSIKTEMNWFGTTRARLGVISGDNFLLFATAGLAYANVDHDFSDPAPAIPGGPGLPFSKSNSDMRYGWTAGCGFEFMRDSHWSLRADALYVDLGSEDHTYTLDPSACGGVCQTRIRWDDNFWVARVGLSYHFGGVEPAAVVPLK